VALRSQGSSVGAVVFDGALRGGRARWAVRGSADRRAPRSASDGARHEAAVARTLSSAREAAARGDHADALAWLAMLEAIGHEFSREDEHLRESWREILAAHAHARSDGDHGASGAAQ
jgi:hypothetical protein